MSEAVRAYRSQAVAAQASGLLQRYRQTRDLADLHAAIRLLRESVTAAPRTRIYYAQCLNDLGNALAIWAERACLSAPAYCAPFPARAGNGGCRAAPEDLSQTATMGRRCCYSDIDVTWVWLLWSERQAASPRLSW